MWWRAFAWCTFQERRRRRIRRKKEKKRRKKEEEEDRSLAHSLERRGIERGKELVVVPHPDISIALMLQKVVALVSS